MREIEIKGYGHSVPNRVVTNNEICENIDSNDEWIRTRTGISKRRFVSDKQYTSDLAAEAVRNAINNAGVDISAIKYLIVCSFSAEFPVPSIACIVQKELGIPDKCTCFDINAACSGFLYGMHVMRGLLLQEDDDSCGIVVGAEVISRHLNMQDRGSCILFGDGAGAVVVGKKQTGLYTFTSGSQGDYDILSVGGRDTTDSYVRMNGADVFRFAVSMVPKCIDDVLGKTGLSLDNIDYVICHQANKRIIDAVRNKYNASPDKFPMNISEYGNTSAASIPILLSELNEQGKLKRGQKIIMTGFGAGLTWGACLMEL